MNDLTKKKIGTILNELLAEKGILQKELAEHIGVTPNTVSYYLSGDRCPDIDKLIEIAKYLNVSTDYLLGLSTSKFIDEKHKGTYELIGLSDDAIINLAEMNDYAINGSKDFRVWNEYIEEKSRKNTFGKLELISFLLESNLSDFMCALDYGVKYKKQLEDWNNRVVEFLQEVKSIKKFDKSIADKIAEKRTKLMNDEYNSVRCNYFEAVDCFRKSLDEYVCDFKKTSDELSDSLFEIYPFYLSKKLKEGE